VAHDRRRIVHVTVTAQATTEWTGQQLRNAFPWSRVPRYLSTIVTPSLARRFRAHADAVGMKIVPSAPRSPWQRAYVERVIGSIRREYLDHVTRLRKPARC
jgi:transposase InsO family protein